MSEEKGAQRGLYAHTVALTSNALRFSLSRSADAPKSPATVEGFSQFMSWPEPQTPPTQKKKEVFKSSKSKAGDDEGIDEENESENENENPNPNQNQNNRKASPNHPSAIQDQDAQGSQPLSSLELSASTTTPPPLTSLKQLVEQLSSSR